MAICRKKIINVFLYLILIFFITSSSSANQILETLKKKKVSYLEFFLLKFENTLSKRARILGKQTVATRVQYSNIGIDVDFEGKKEKISILIYAIMDKHRYSKKKYKQKLSDCNQIRNLIFYQKHGYKFFTQKRDSALSIESMINIFKEVFFDNINFNEKEINFLLDRMFVNVTILHPINKKELSCGGRVNDYELK